MGAHKTDTSRLVQHGFLNLWDPNENILKKKIHLFYCMIKVRISGGLLTDYIRNPNPIIIKHSAKMGLVSFLVNTAFVSKARKGFNLLFIG